MEKVKIGIIGIGNMGSSHCKFICQDGVENLELTAVCDIIPERMEKPKGITLPETVKKFTSAEELMDSGVCEAVIIAVPHYLHPPMTIMALSKGLHVMCEKPAGVYTKQVKEMNAVAEKSEVMKTVDIMAKGMLGIFVVMIMIYIVIAILGKVTGGKKKAE